MLSYIPRNLKEKKLIFFFLANIYAAPMAVPSKWKKIKKIKRIIPIKDIKCWNGDI